MMNRSQIVASLSMGVLLLTAASITSIDFVTQVKRKPFFDVREYNFPPQRPGGTLTAASPTSKTLSPCPVGLNGSDTKHYLYVFNGIGTAEAVLITGGTCVSGAASGTVLFTPAQNHSGGWQIQSGTSGIQEAMNACPATGCTIRIVGVATLFAGVSAPSTGMITVEGDGLTTFQILRSSDFTAGDLFSNINTSCSWTFRNLFVSQNGGFVQSGAAFFFDHPTVAQYMEGVSIVNGQKGIILKGTTFVSLDRVFYTQVDDTFTAVVGIEITDGAGNTYISNSAFGASRLLTHILQYGMYIHSGTGGVDGLWVVNSGISGNIPLNIIADGPFTGDIQFTNFQIDGVKNTAILIGGNSGPCSSMQFNNMHVGLQGHNGWDATGAGVDIGFSGGATTCDDISFNGGYISGSNTWGVVIGSVGGKGLSFRNLDIRDNNRDNIAGRGGMYIENGVTGLTVEDVAFYDDGTGHQKYGIFTNGTLSGLIAGNRLAGETAPIVLSGAMTGVLANNQGFNDGRAFGSFPACKTAAPLGTTIYATDGNSGCTAGGSTGRTCVCENGTSPAWTH